MKITIKRLRQMTMGNKVIKINIQGVDYGEILAETSRTFEVTGESCTLTLTGLEKEETSIEIKNEKDLELTIKWKITNGEIQILSFDEKYMKYLKTVGSKTAKLLSIVVLGLLTAFIVFSMISLFF